MVKEKIAKIELIGGRAKPGPALAGIGINMGQFIKDFNDRTSNRDGEVVPVVITVINKSFTFVCKSSPTAILLKKYTKIDKGAKSQKEEIVATISKEDICKISKLKLEDSNTLSIESMEKMVIGTATQMGIKIK
ncbi:large ribosomal subunit protein uL11m [Rhinoraja longicauda]